MLDGSKLVYLTELSVIEFHFFGCLGKVLSCFFLFVTLYVAGYLSSVSNKLLFLQKFSCFFWHNVLLLMAGLVDK